MAQKNIRGQRCMLTAREFKQAFEDFFNFTLSLLENVENDNQFKFIVINAQITLELFMKAYFLELNMPDKVFKTKNGQLVNKTRDFSDILHDFIKHEVKWGANSKKILIDLLEIRNEVVHRGQNPKFDQDMASEIIKILFFINLTSVNELGKAIFQEKYEPSKISKNETWRNGVRDFIDDVMDLLPIDPLECLHCFQSTLFYSNELKMVDGQESRDLLCLTCFGMINSDFGKLATCYICKKSSYIYDAANPQDNGQYLGKCINTNCRNKEWISTCRNCEDLFFESESQHRELCVSCHKRHRIKISIAKADL